MLLAAEARTSRELDRVVAAADEKIRAKNRAVTSADLGIAIARLDRDEDSYDVAGAREDQPMYPASVVKLFFGVFAMDQLAAGRLAETDEFLRGLADMLVDSSNDATALVVDTLTGTTGGPELGADQLRDWMYQRQAVNRWFAARGYHGLEASQKTWNEAPYGRERQGYGAKQEFRNSFSPALALRLMAELALGPGTTDERVVEWHDWILRRLRRPIKADVGESATADYQSDAFIGAALPAGSVIHSKAGYTNEVRHDVAWIQLPSLARGSSEFVFSIFTRGMSCHESFVSECARALLDELGA